jgi:nucleotidyltransferase substrate binding protein (TIGR01987 family)
MLQFSVLSSVSNWLGSQFKSGRVKKAWIASLPRGGLRVAFKTDWIEDEKEWLAMLADRNQTSHTYDEDLAKAVYRRRPNHLLLLEALVTKLKQ